MSPIRRFRLGLLGGCLAAVAAGMAPSAAAARDAIVTSFDDTPIVTHFFPAPGLKTGERRPTVLYGPGWAGAGQTDTSEASTIEQVGMARLLEAGYNVVTWDPRGFGGSGDVSRVDGPDYEARDVSRVIDFIAGQPEARLDGPGDPRVGMVGGSYGGGIQWVTAGTDRRVDAIVPGSSWNTLPSSLFPEGSFKTGIVTLLYALGVSAGTAGGIASPAGPQTGSVDPHVHALYSEGMTTGAISADTAAWFASRGPWNVLGEVRAPTLVVQGTVDILFTPSEAIRNYRALAAGGVPVKMMWYCGGHGTCLDDPGPDTDRVPRATLAWLARHLRGDESVDTGPGFEWVSQDGLWHAAPGYPLRAADKPLVATGSGELSLYPSPGSGTPQYASSSSEGVRVEVPAVTGDRVEIVGEPELRMTYSGTATPASTWAYAQVVDRVSGNVVGNQATPIPLTLDGAKHTVERPLNGIAYSATPASRLQLQVVPASALFRQQSATGTVSLESIELKLPAGAPYPAPPATLPEVKAALGLRVLGRPRPGLRKLRVRLSAQGRTLRRVRVDLRRRGRLVARATARSLRPARTRTVVLRLRAPLRRGTYSVSALARDSDGAPLRARRTLRSR